jgi:DNA mismatch repair protein MutS2
MQDFLNSFDKLEFYKVKQRIAKYAISEYGKEKILNLLPTNSIPLIQFQLDVTSEMKLLLESDDPLPIDNLIDIRSHLNRASILDSILAANEIYAVGMTLKISRIISSYFSRRKINYPLLNKLIEPTYIDKILEYNIDRAIDENGKVKDNATNELRKIRIAMSETTELLRKKLGQILKAVSQQGWAQEEIITSRDGRMVIPIKIENKNRIPGFIHSSSSSGATVFIEPTETLELNNDLRTLQFQEIREIEKILKDLTNQIRGVKEKLVESMEVLSTLDFIQAKAKYSIEIIGTAPRISSSAYTNMIEVRHPLLLLKHSRKDVKPLSLEIGKEYVTLIITGPNAGGKSVALKTIGLLVLMVQSGLHVPASNESEINIYDKLFVDIGDEQSIENDLSTFSSHLSNLKDIIENADKNSLVLIDEIGTGTDPTEGGALAESVLEELTFRKVHVLATTHHGTLKAFAYETDNIENGAMEFNHETLEPTYRFKSGIPGSSYAFEMAKRIGIPNFILEQANKYRGEVQHNLENLLGELELQAQRLNIETNKTIEENKKLKQLISYYTDKNKIINAEVKTIKLKAIEEGKQLLDGINKLIERSVQKIREKSGDKDSLKKVKEDIKSFKLEFKAVYEDAFSGNEESTADDFIVGDFVKIKGGSEIGEILESVSSESFNVLFGQIKIITKKTDLVKVKDAGKKKLYTGSTFDYSHDKISTEIDLRGMLGDEAVNMIDKFIDTALLRGLNRIDLIHGKGTGALRKKISEYLQRHPSVNSFRLGTWNEGGHGVTVVELK